MSSQIRDAEIADSAWEVLYKFGGVAALCAVVLFRRHFGAELMLLNRLGIIRFGLMTPTNNPIEWFTLFQKSRLLGLCLFDFVDLINYTLVGLIFLALYGALRSAHRSPALIATSFCFVGIAVYFASNQAFSMLSLSNQYAAAATEAQRSILEAAGQSLLAINNPSAVYQGGGFYMSLFLVLAAGLIVSLLMLRSHVFGKVTGYFGVLANGFALGYFIAIAFAPALCAIPLSISAPFRLVWYILIARRLFTLRCNK